jgi:hypothetical protein
MSKGKKEGSAVTVPSGVPIAGMRPVEDNRHAPKTLHFTSALPPTESAASDNGSAPWRKIGKIDDAEGVMVTHSLAADRIQPVDHVKIDFIPTTCLQSVTGPENALMLFVPGKLGYETTLVMRSPGRRKDVSQSSRRYGRANARPH